MNRLYLAPVETVLNAEIGAHQALECPTNANLRLVVVEHWISDVAQDRFEAMPGVVPLYPWDGGKPVPLALVQGFADVKVAAVSALDTLESALWKIRAAWPAARY
jgi:hypothetical protein